MKENFSKIEENEFNNQNNKSEINYDIKNIKGHSRNNSKASEVTFELSKEAIETPNTINYQPIIENVDSLNYSEN